MKRFILLIFLLSGLCYAQTIDSLSRVQQVADSVMLQGIGKEFYKAYVSSGPITRKISASYYDKGDGSPAKKKLFFLARYYITIYGKKDSLELYIYPDFKAEGGFSVPNLADSLQDPLKYPIMRAAGFWKQFRKEKGIKKTLTFAFYEDGIIAFFYCTKKHPSDKDCKWSMAIHLQGLVNYGGHWWCEHH